MDLPLDGTLDLHAFAARDVVRAVEAYIEACRERNVLQLRLVHGKGTGYQRRAVQETLRKNPAVRSFRTADEQAGGWGATLVELWPAGEEQHAEAPPSEWEAGEEVLETRIRLYGIPAALIAARIALALPGGHFLVRVFASMWIHEIGHATTAWLCGYLAFPGPWLTPTAAERSPLFAVVVSALLVTLAWRTPKARVPAIAALGLQLFCTWVLKPTAARQLIVFMGDGGCLVLGAALMATLYATGHLKTSWLRWGFLAIGAAAFTDAFEQWWAARTDPDRIPFGRNEGVGLSDPSVLSDEFGWSAGLLVRRYLTVGFASLAALALVYVRGLRRRRLSHP